MPFTVRLRKICHLFLLRQSPRVRGGLLWAFLDWSIKFFVPRDDTGLTTGPTRPVLIHRAPVCEAPGAFYLDVLPNGGFWRRPVKSVSTVLIVNLSNCGIEDFTKRQQSTTTIDEEVLRISACYLLTLMGLFISFLKRPSSGSEQVRQEEGRSIDQDYRNRT